MSKGYWILGVFLFAIWTWESSFLDQTLADFFYTHHQFASNSFLNFVYLYGIVPAWIVIVLAGVALCVPQRPDWRKPALFLILTFAIGAGLIVHGILKDHWGRPRPKQVIEYGGNQPFRPYYQPQFFDQPEPSKSFPCGHCSTGFYFFSVARMGTYYRNRYVYYGGLTLAWGLGLLLGYVRIAQGGHFFSDVVFSALIMWATAYFLYRKLLHKESSLN